MGAVGDTPIPHLLTLAAAADVAALKIEGGGLLPQLVGEAGKKGEVKATSRQIFRLPVAMKQITTNCNYLKTQTNTDDQASR